MDLLIFLLVFLTGLGLFGLLLYGAATLLHNRKSTDEHQHASRFSEGHFRLSVNKTRNPYSFK